MLTKQQWYQRSNNDVNEATTMLAKQQPTNATQYLQPDEQSNASHVIITLRSEKLHVSKRSTQLAIDSGYTVLMLCWVFVHVTNRVWWDQNREFYIKTERLFLPQTADTELAQ